jgi:hypothetical protein
MSLPRAELENRWALGWLSGTGIASMNTVRKALVSPCAVPRYRGELRARPPSSRMSKLPAMILGLTVVTASCAAIAGSFTLETGELPQAASTLRTPRTIIETRFLIAPAAGNVRKLPPQAEDVCDDLAFRFLNSEKCADSRGKHGAPPRRAPTVVTAHSGTPSLALNQSRACDTGLNESGGHCGFD